MKRKFLPALCTVALCAAMLAGCADTEEKKNTETTQDTAQKETQDTEEESPFADDTESLTEEDMNNAGDSQEDSSAAEEEELETSEDEVEAPDADGEETAKDKEQKGEASQDDANAENASSSENGAKAQGETEAVPEGAEQEDGIYHAQITIKDYGVISLELDANIAPVTVENFVKLAKDGFYDGLTFHRIMDGFMIQGGDPLGNGTGGSDETIKGEFASNGVENTISHKRGTISMARSTDPDSASSQFFIMHQDAEYLDGEYAGFGHVTEGMEVVDAICADAEPVDNNGNIEKDKQPVIESITVED